jgi:ATP-binding cassette, subfamily B, bacterial PglK
MAMLILLNLIRPNEKSKLTILALLMLFGSFLEALGISIIIPVVTLVLDPNSVQRFELFRPVLQYLTAEGLNWQLVAITLLFVLFLFKSSFISFVNWYQFRTIFLIERRLSQDLFATYLSSSYIYSKELKVAEVSNNVIKVTSTFCISVLLSAATIFSEGSALIAIILVLLFVEPSGTILVFAVLGTFGGAFYYLARHKMEQWGNQRLMNEALCFKDVKDGIGGIKEIKLLRREGYFHSKFVTHSDLSAESAKNYLFVQQLPRIWLEMIAVMGISTMLALMLIRDRPASEILPIVSAFGLASFRMLPSASKIISSITNIKFGLAATKKLSNELQVGRDKIKSITFKVIPRDDGNFQTGIQLRCISFKYPQRSVDVISGVSFYVNRGDCIGIVGESGSGKSTLIDLVLGLLSPSVGDILIDQRKLEDKTLDQWQLNIGYVAQTTYMMDTSIKENIAFGAQPSEIDDNLVVSALKQSQLYDFVMTLPNGLDTLLGDNGVALSGGQRQRIGIARALYREPDVLILDEATSALDHNTEDSLMRAVSYLIGMKTILIISHKASTLSICNRIFEVKDGLVKEMLMRIQN